ncbi:flagellar hook-associated protein FlgL [Aneurinibacillus sp. Ricciae_BoGa-3]|uniref:flagellar hook-associated protein FlgL n=1 Tax=Aneurinibacillus sp. Ricciae_BoGa-3 TaxID=3022697 RepID=UPI00233FB8C5|nr:flagellar hook-associated protein FlgL [Aneurinibacillus sp. Ricciae_BoGa-3]WCK56902.1 flagellar hook-associated protein FlgL [Aneurinibacillus sp. Ricciae_BoGa-3]
MTKPSQDPIAAIQGMYYRTNLAENQQFKDNTNEATNWMNQYDSSLSEGVNILSRVKDLLTQAANDTNTATDRQNIKTEIEQLRDQLGTVANTTLNGKYIFNGTQTLTPPYDQNLNPPDLTGNIDNTDINLEVSQALKIPVNIKPGDVFGAQGTSVFSTLGKVINDLNDPTKTGTNISTDIGSIQGHLDTFTKVQASVGSRTNRIQLIQNRLDTQYNGSTKMLSDAEDADMAKVITDLQNAENVQRAALSAGSRIIQPSLVDFLK